MSGGSDAIWWISVCGNRSKEDAFWDSDLTWETNNPDFTRCFQFTILVWVPCLVLWLMAPFYVFYLSGFSVKHGACHFSGLNAFKSLFCILLMGLSVGVLVHTAVNVDNAVIAEYVAPCVYILTYSLALWLVRYEFRRGQHSSGLMFCFWLLLLLCNIITVRSICIKSEDQGFQDSTGFGLYIAMFTILVLQFLLHLVADPGAYRGSTWCDEDEERQPLLANHSPAPNQVSVTAAAAEEDRSVKKLTCPEKTASFLSRMTYVWCSRLLLDGYKRQLSAERLWQLRPQDTARNIIHYFYVSWIKSSKDRETRKLAESMMKNLKRDSTPDIMSYSSGHSQSQSQVASTTWKTKSSLTKAMWKSFGFYYSIIAVYEILNIALTFVRPLLLDALISFVEDREDYLWKGYLFAFLMFVVTILRAIINQQHFYGKMITGQRIRSAITAAVYRKSLLLANSSRKEYSVGSIVNLMSVDAQRMADATFFLHNIWSAPVNIIVAMVMLWNYLGPSSLAGLGILILLMALNFYLATRIKRLQTLQMQFKDTRTKLTNEILSGIKVLKLYAWEGAFQKKLLAVRDKELDVILKAAFYISGTAISFTCAPVLYTVVSFSIYILTSGNALLSAQVAFVSLSLVNSLTRPLAFLPNGIANVVQAMVSIKRVEGFLNGDELDPSAVSHNHTGDDAIQVKNASFSWDGTAESTVLKNISFSVKEGSLACIVGQVGSGKSSLLSAMLGELYKQEGSVNYTGRIAYVPQEPWVRNITLEKNILFGKPLYRDLYNSAIEDCALKADLKMLPGGDQTEIGEKGINLSGGQKQRVSLARAVYQDCDVYLLDDPLSAVDAHVGKHIYKHVLGKEGCLKHKTRVLVTHGITFLPKADQIIVLKDGQISEMGTYEELLSHAGAFAELMNSYLNEGNAEEEGNGDPEDKMLKEELKRQISTLSGLSDKTSESEIDNEEKPRIDLSPKRTKRKISRDSSKDSQPAKKQGVDKAKGDAGPKKGEKLIETEKTELGGVKWKILFAYLRSMGGPAIAAILLSFFFNMGADFGSNIWLSEWSSDTAKEAANQTYMDPNIRVGVYGGLGGLQTLTILAQTLGLAYGVVISSRIIHERLLDAIVKAPMSFFDTTPTGRILNRFTQDMATADSALRFTIMSTLRGLSGLLITTAAISYTTPIFLVMVFPLAIMYYFIQRFYIMSSNQLRRLGNVRTSPIYSHFGETITGASSIRAYRQQNSFRDESDRLLDGMQEARFPGLITNRWLSIWLETLGGLVVLFCSLFAVLSRDTITGGLVGLSISYALQLTDRLAFFLRNTSDLENNVVSIERIMEYSQTNPEAPWFYDGHRPPSNWPAEGIVQFENYSTRYRPGLDLVLKNINCTMGSGQKIGIVGRTGAGKSSMTLALFRIIEPASGSISIDSMKSVSVGLHDLRSKLTIIPQDPVLFTGTLRFNVDPFNEHSDNEIWDSFSHAHLKNFVESLPDKLSHECTEGGQNLSVGQRQLVCLARALLRRTKILVLDEATAAVDLETDDLIQTTIRSEFRDNTVITIAHRINTVMDYDKIMVLDGGSIVEYDAPEKLMGNKDSFFYSLCKDAGLVT